MSPSLDPPSMSDVRSDLRHALQERLSNMSEVEIIAYLSEAVFLERRRFARKKSWSEEDRDEQRAIERAASATHGDAEAASRALTRLVDRYAHEIHNRFSDRTYKIATRFMPGALTRLLTATHPRGLLESSFDPTSRIRVDGPIDELLNLSKSHTLILAPTHVSNLDSPLVGYAIYTTGLPPCIYGAGLNLFNNPAMSFFMGRLGAYTVDRRKKHRLYKDVLKDYSASALSRGQHSLFYPGGTRMRSGKIEDKVKKGLLGTGITAWQDSIENGRSPSEVLVVPCTLSYTLVLEAETLIEDALEEEGQSRYIITDDEFSEPLTVATFARKVLQLDASVHIRLGQALDLVGNPVNADGQSLDPSGEPFDRRRYVTDEDGQVRRDPQRDRVYTQHLAQALVAAWKRDHVVLDTQLVALAAWQLLVELYPHMDTWQRVFLSPNQRVLDRPALVARVRLLHDQVEAAAAEGRLHSGLLSTGPQPEEEILDRAVDRFGRFHSRHALEPLDGGRAFRIDPRLILYYANRLADYGLGEGEDR
jgi:glycerol-3-phosphate O-acyltransferase